MSCHVLKILFSVQLVPSYTVLEENMTKLGNKMLSAGIFKFSVNLLILCRICFLEEEHGLRLYYI